MWLPCGGWPEDMEDTLLEIFLREDYDQIAVVVPEEAVEGIRDSLDCNLAFFGTPVGLPAMYAVLGLATLALVGLYILLHAVKKKTV